MRAMDEKRKAPPVTKLDRLMFRQMGWALLPSHTRIVAHLGRHGPMSLSNLRDGLGGVGYGEVYARCRTLAEHWLVEIRKVPGSSKFHQAVRSLVLTPLAHDLLAKAGAAGHLEKRGQGVEVKQAA